MNMKIRHFILFLFVYTTAFSQIEDAWVYFKDKPNSETYLSNPLAMLTQRALDRRTAQNIALDISDVPISESYIDQITFSTGITVKAKSKWLNCLHIRGSQANINALKLLFFVAKVDFADETLNSSNNRISEKQTNKFNGRIAEKNEINSVSKVAQTKTNYNYGNSANQIQMLNGHLLHQLNYTGTGKIIAVLDSGFPGVNTAQPFERLRTNNQILGGYNYVGKSSNFYVGDSHGTWVLSFMGGYKDGQLVGTAPDANYYLFITEDVASENPVEESNWVEAAEEADRLGVDIITSSLGYFGYDNVNYSHTYVTMTGNMAFASRGANIAFNKGMVVLASAGNEGLKKEKHIGVPAEAMNVIAVGSVNKDETYTDISSIGPSYDKRVKPDVMAQGRNPYYSDTLGNITNAESGTSFSCPITAGMIACLWQALPTKTNQQIKQLIIQSADKYSSPTIYLGYGIPDFNLALSNALSTTTYSESDCIMYPNPTNDLITFTLPESSSSGLISIYSLLGQKVLENKITSQLPIVSLKSLSKGMYFYKIELDGFLKRGKIIKQ
jgi:serine protease AprX